MALTFPKLPEISSMLSDLIGKKVEIRASKTPLQPGARNPCVVAEFNHPDGELAVLLLVDVPFACHTGASLAMLPLSEAEDSIAEGKVSEGLMENYHEIANVMTALFRSAGVRLVLGEIHTDIPSLSFDMKMAIRRPAARLDCDVVVPDYGACRASLLSVPTSAAS